MSKMSNLHLTITDYLEQGDNAFRVAAVLNVPLEWVQEIEKEVRVAEQVASWFVNVNGVPVHKETSDSVFVKQFSVDI